MVTVLLRSALREIRGSLGRYLAIMAIVGLGVGFFAGLRMGQPDMIATGADYLQANQFHDVRLLSTLGFTEEDTAYFAAQDSVEAVVGSYFAEFLWSRGDEDVVLVAHALTDGINAPVLKAGRMPENSGECLADELIFTEADLGKTVTVSAGNDEDTLELLVHDSYTIVGIADTPLYLDYDRGTSSIGSGSISGFLLIPADGFDSEAYHEIFLRLKNAPGAYSKDYESFMDSRKDTLESQTEERGQLRYETIYTDAMTEILDGEQELLDGWAEYRTERAKAEQELADALQELTDGEAEYADGLADYEQGKIDYADGLAEYEDALVKIADAEQELADGWREYEEGKAEAEKELADAYAELTDGEAEYADGLRQYEEGLAELADAEQKLLDGEAALKEADAELNDARAELNAAKKQLDTAKAELDAGEASYDQLGQLYGAGQAMADGFGAGSVDELFAMADANPMVNAMLNGALQSQGSSLEEFREGWDQAEAQLGGSLDETTLTGLRNQLDAGAAAYQDGLAQYEDGREQYDDGCTQVARNEEKLKKAKKELEEGRQELLDAKAELDDARVQLDDGWREYEEGKAEAERELADALQKLTDGEQELADGKAELADAKRELADAEKDLQKAPAELADGRQELDDGWAEYYDGLAEAEQEFADAEAELFDGEAELADAREELADLQRPDVYVLTRSENKGYAGFDNDTSIIAAISVVFPVFFFLVAAMVCMTTMTRMVDEQRTQIGVLKALGYSNRQVMGKYLLYSGSAAAVGSIAGYAVGSTALPLVVWEIYGIMYGFAPLELQFDVGLAIISVGAALLCSMGATWFACRAELRRNAAELIRPKTPKAGRRVFLEYITPVWKHLSFLQKVSVRNVLRYRSRLVMMVLGIGGCTALLVTGFGLRDSLSSVMDDQFEQITLYDYSVTFRDPVTADEAAAYLAAVDKAEQGLLVHSGSADVVTGQGSKSVFLVVSSTDSLEGYISLHSEGEAIPYPGEGEVVINFGLAQEMDLAVGDRIRLRDDDFGTVEVSISAICDNFVSNYAYVSNATYLAQLGKTPETETIFLLAEEGEDPFAQGVLLGESEDVSSVQINEATRRQVSSTLERMDLIIVIVVVCAGALAFIVLYNLTNINITERIREIATIKVLGFYRKETATYVFREIRILAAVGSLVGLGLGKALHTFVMAQVQVDGMFFPCYILPVSYVISVVLTMFFTVVITRTMHPKLDRVDMAESLKSIE